MKCDHCGGAHNTSQCPHNKSETNPAKRAKLIQVPNTYGKSEADIEVVHAFMADNQNPPLPQGKVLRTRASRERTRSQATLRRLRAQIDSGAQVSITNLKGANRRGINAQVLWGDKRGVQVQEESDIDLNVNDLQLMLGTWHVPGCSGTLVALRALLDMGARAIFTKDRSVIILPDGEEIELDRDFGFWYTTSAQGQEEMPDQIAPEQVRAATGVMESPYAEQRHANVVAGPAQTLGGPRALWRMSNPHCAPPTPETLEIFIRYLEAQEVGRADALATQQAQHQRQRHEMQAEIDSLRSQLTASRQGNGSGH
jgi:hypothetical protein